MADERGTIDERVRGIIEARVESVWNSATAVQYPGVDGVVDVDGSFLELPPTGANWLRVHYEYANTDILTIAPDSGGLNRTEGVIHLTVFTPSGLGEAPLWALVGVAKSIFDRYNGTIRCGASGAGRKLQEGGWLQASVSTPFVFYASIS